VSGARGEPHFGISTLTTLAREIATTDPDTNRWCNLWRLSDQLGGPVAFDPDSLDAIRERRTSDYLLVNPQYRASRQAGPTATPATRVTPRSKNKSGC
jgi:hypothetical protein